MQSTSTADRPHHSSATPHSLLHHASCAVGVAKQSAARLSQQLWLDSSLPFKLLAAAWLLTNVLLPLLLINHPLAQSTLVHAFAAVSGSVLLHHLLGDGPFLFTAFLSLLPLLLPHTPATFVEVESRTVLLLPRVLFPRLLPLWRQLQLVVNTVVVAAVVEQVRRHVMVSTRQAGASGETSMRLDVPVTGHETNEGQWEVSITLAVRSNRGGEREDERGTGSGGAEEGARQKQRRLQQTEQQHEWSTEERREREEAEYPRGPPSSPADSPMKMKVAVKEGGGSQTGAEGCAAAEEGRGEFQSPRPRASGAGWDVAGLRKVLDPLAAEHECFKPSSDTVAAPHGDPLVKAEQKQQQAGREQQKK